MKNSHYLLTQRVNACILFPWNDTRENPIHPIASNFLVRFFDTVASHYR